MTAAALVEKLRAQDVTLTVAAGRLRMDAPPGVLTDPLVESIREIRPEIIDLLTRETAAQVEKVGVLQQYWQKRAEGWDDARYERNKAILLYRLEQMEARLMAEGSTLATYGWNVTGAGIWHRIGEAAPARVTARPWQLIHDAYETLGQRVPAGALDWAEVERPEVATRLDRAETEWAEAYEKRDSRAFKRALTSLTMAGDRLAEAYENREHPAAPDEEEALLFDSDNATAFLQGA